MPLHASWPGEPDTTGEIDTRIWPRNATVAADGVLRLAGADVRDLVAEFGTPLFVVDEADVRSRCRDFRVAFDGVGVHYAAKAFCAVGVLRWIAAEGLGVDVCTGGELAVALGADFPPERITMHGNNKSVAELERAVAAGVGCIVVDSYEEIARLAHVAAARSLVQDVMVRATVGVEAHTHEFIATAHEDQKFGFSLAGGAAVEAMRRVSTLPSLHLAGIHSHIGSQIYDTAGFEVAAKRAVGLLVQARDELGLEPETLDLGGGFGIAYVQGDDPMDIDTLAKSLLDIVATECERADYPQPRLSIEPGRAIIGPATVTIYEVGTVKTVKGVRRFVSVDGGMSDNIRTALYGAEYTAMLASRRSGAHAEPARVVGKHCESGDIVVRDATLPADLVPGDLIAVAATGAYCRSMASNYNHVPRPAVLAVIDGRPRLLIRRETEDDLLRLDVG